MKCVKGLGFLWEAVLAAFFALTACDDSSSASSDETSVSSSSVEPPDSSVTLSPSTSSGQAPESAESNGSSNENMEKDKSSSSVKGSEPVEVSSSSTKETKVSSDSKSSSSVKTGDSSSSNKDKSSSSVSSSSSEITDYVGLPCEGILSDGNTGKIYLCVDGRYVLYVPTESSSSGPYEPFDQTLPLEKFKEERYKTFTDSRNGRVYYYLTIMGKDEDGVKDTIDVMAQNLNIADVTLKAGENMTDDTKIERYCYNDDKENCHKYGRLYTWKAAMKACPTGWKLPDRKDWNFLSKYLGSSKKNGFRVKQAGQRICFGNNDMWSPYCEETKASFSLRRHGKVRILLDSHRRNDLHRKLRDHWRLQRTLCGTRHRREQRLLGQVHSKVKFK